ncbi:hypothetical protein [Haliea sp. E17]|uniref:hypothetical protein n=1 Tax=Haliea sp. E17 TaxID=3401576 RepID=UPI003AAD1070
MNEFERAIRDQLNGSRDYGESNPAYTGFVKDLSSTLAQLNSTLGSLQGLWPEGAKQRYEMAARSIKDLHRSLSRMGDSEHLNLIPPSEETMQALGLDDDCTMLDCRQAIGSWVKITIAIGQALEQKSTVQKRESKTDRAEGAVLVIAQAWHKAFGKWPADKSTVFEGLVNKLLELCPCEEDSLSPNSISGILKANVSKRRD